jgi:cobalt-zinc-cadmium efflux system protein
VAVHSHADHAHVPARTVLAALIVTLGAAGAEVAGAREGRSLFLAADAVHLFAHAGIFLVLLIPAARGHEVGEDLATMAVLTVVGAVAVGIAVAAIKALTGPAGEPPHPAYFLLALVGLAANLICAYLFKEAAASFWSFRAALAHQLSDAAHRVAGLFGALAIKLFAWPWVDPGLSLVVALWLGWWAGRLLLRRVRYGPGVWTIEDER